MTIQTNAGKTKPISLSREEWARFILLFLVACILVLKHFFLIIPSGPTIFADEYLYKDNALRIFEGSLFATAHYPPLYSLLLSLGFYFENWYDAMIALNGILSSLLLVPVWLIARRFISNTMSIFVVLLTALLPYQVVYPRLIMAENLSVTVFTLAVLLALEGIEANKVQAYLLGFTLALGFLTKYLFLPEIPVLILYWFYVNKIVRGLQLSILKRDDVSKLLILCIGIFSALLPWLLYANMSRIPLARALGVGISGINSTQISTGSFLQFAAAYGAYIILAGASVLLPVILYFFSAIRQSIKNRSLSKSMTFVILVFGLAGLYWLVGTQHSFGAEYNYPTPQNIQGRYLIHLPPLFLISGILIIEHLYKLKYIFSLKTILFATGLSLVLVYTAYWVLFVDNFWRFPEWFARSEFLLPDAFEYKDPTVIPWSLACITGLGFWLWLSIHRITWMNRQVRVLIACAFLLLIQINVYKVASIQVSVETAGKHSRKIAQILKSDCNCKVIEDDIYYHIPGLPERQLQRGLVFWGMDIPTESVHEFWIDSEVGPYQDVDKPFLFVTSGKYNAAFIDGYDVDHVNYSVYLVDPQNMSLANLEIIDFSSVKSLTVGMPINEQPGGESAFWLVTKNVSPTTVVVFSGVELNTVIVSSEYLTALLPNEFISEPGSMEIYLIDKLTGEKSKRIEIEVREP